MDIWNFILQYFHGVDTNYKSDIVILLETLNKMNHDFASVFLYVKNTQIHTNSRRI